jgi:hypothetical protein
MKYTLVNKNRLIPHILYFDNEKSAINELIEITNYCNNSALYLKNIYIVCETDNNNYIIFNNGNNIIKLFNDKTEIINYSYTTSENILNKLENLFINNKKIELNIKKNIKSKMIDIQNIDIQNNDKENNDKENNKNNDEDNELKRSCNEVFQLYNQEILKIKKIENIIKNLEKKEEKIINKIKNDNIDKINKLYYDCNTFIKINEKVNYSVNFSVPELFSKKYNYFYNLCNTSDDFNVILKKIKEFDINNINDNIKIDNDLISFAKKYFDESKELNNTFDHNWDDLSVDVDGIAKAKSSSRLY